MNILDIHTRQLRYFMELAQCLNFTKAAVRLYIAQPALSQQIAELEKQLGVTLFVRNSRSVSLTPAGKILLEACPEILNKLENVSEQLLLAQSGVNGTLRIGYLGEPFQNRLPEIIRSFAQQYPQVRLEFHQYTLEELYRALEHGRIDVGFGYLYSDQFPGLSKLRLWQEDLCLAVHDSFVPASSANPYSPLEELTLLTLEVRAVPQYEALIRQACADMAIVPKRRVSAQRTETIMLQVEANMGFSVLPESVANYGLGHAKFIPIRKNHMELGALWQENTANPAVALFLDVVESYVQVPSPV